MRMAIALWLVAGAAVAQPQLGPSELARAKAVLDKYKAELSAEQFTLLSSKLAQTQQAYFELTTLTEATAVAAESVAGAEVAAAGGRTVLGGIVEALPLLLFVYPATAHAPGLKEEKPKVREARTKLEASVKELTEAVRKVEREKQAATIQKKPGDPAPNFVPSNWVYPPGKRPCDVIGSGGDGLSKPRGGPVRCDYLCGTEKKDEVSMGQVLRGLSRPEEPADVLTRIAS